ncbi:MAG: flagellin, partial [Clostridiales bacterium]|nr:flagellin [Clostridiales bacterium]
GIAAQINADPLTVDNKGADDDTSTLTFTATVVNDTDLVLTSQRTSENAGDLAAEALTVSGSSGKYNYVDTFGARTSQFDVVNKAGAGLTFQVGANEGDELTINIDKMDSNYLGVASAKVTTQKAASAAISAVDKAINRVSSQRAYLGAIQNRLEYKINNLEISTENLTSAESQIRDVDMAKEMTNFTNANILQQAATAMLAQANALPQNVLSLIGG